jgi:hypothetical protein
MANIPTSPNFDFNDIGVMGPYSTLILVGEPNVATSLELGSLTPVQPNQVNYMIRLNGGELGTPGVEITIRTPAITAAAPAIAVTLSYEPGVSTKTQSDEDWYNLTRFAAQWLGGSGGGGYMYDHDPNIIRNSTLDIKRRTLRVRIATHGFVPSDPAALAQLRQRFSTAGNRNGQLLELLTSSDFTGKFYFTVPDLAAVQVFNDDVLNHLQRAHQLRVTPYHQYSSPVNIVGLDMDPLPGFRRHMMCDRIFHGAVPMYSAPHKVISDTIGRRDVRLVSMIHGVGICREEQAHDLDCAELRNASVMIKVVRTRNPVLQKATQNGLANNLYGQPAEPLDQYVYLGFCKIVSRGSQAPIRVPRPGSLGYVSWVRHDGQRWAVTQDQAFGMVLAPHALHAAMQADFVMALYVRDAAIKQRASFDPATAQPERVLYTHIRNRQTGQQQLGGMERLGAMASGNSLLANLRTVMIPQDIRAVSFRRIDAGPEDTHPPDTCRAAAAWFSLSSLMANYTTAELDVLNISAQIDGYIARIRTTTGGNAARSVYGLMGILMLVGYRLVVAIDEPAVQSEFLYGLHRFLQAVERDQMWPNRPNLRSKRTIHASFVDVDVAPVADVNSTDLSSPRHPLRRRMGLVFRFMLGGLAEEAVLYDSGPYHASPANNPPLNCTPQVWSMADRISDYLLRNPALRTQYYADRARVLNPGVIPEDELISIEGRIRTVYRAVVAEQDVVVCDYNTAMSPDIVTSFEKHVVIFGSTHRVPFSKVAAAIVLHSSLQAAVLLGYPADQRFGPMQLASLGRNEAIATFGRSAWEVLERGGGSLSTDVL